MATQYAPTAGRDAQPRPESGTQPADVFPINGTDYIEFYVDGEQYAHTTSHVPPAAVDGGVDSAPGVGEQTWWSVGDQTGTNTLTLTEFKYSAIG